MQFKRFHQPGLARFRAYLAELRQSPSTPPPAGLLNDDGFSEPLDDGIEAEVKAFPSRMAFATWLHAAAKNSGAEVPRGDARFWAWLTLALFDQVCPVDGHGRRKVGAVDRYIPNDADWRRRSRHLLRNPYDIFWVHRAEPGCALVALANPLQTPGELAEQLGNRTEIVNCKGSMALGTLLYIDPVTQRQRTGATGKKGARRLGKLLNQYTLTFDLPEIDVASFAARLPKEQQKFVKAARSSAAGAEP